MTIAYAVRRSGTRPGLFQAEWVGTPLPRDGKKWRPVGSEVVKLMTSSPPEERPPTTARQRRASLRWLEQEARRVNALPSGSEQRRRWVEARRRQVEEWAHARMRRLQDQARMYVTVYRRGRGRLRKALEGKARIDLPLEATMRRCTATRSGVTLEFELPTQYDVAYLSLAFGLAAGRLRICRKARCRHLFVTSSNRRRTMCPRHDSEEKLRRLGWGLSRDLARLRWIPLQHRLAKQVERGNKSSADRDTLLLWAGDRLRLVEQGKLSGHDWQNEVDCKTLLRQKRDTR